MRNRVRQLRQKASLSQRALATAARTSQQQIQRIEAGVIQPRYSLAVSVAAALGKSLEEVFPATRSVAKAMRQGETSLTDSKVARGLRKAGIDPDPRVWTFQLYLTNGVRRQYIVNSSEMRRLERMLTDEENKEFLVFDAEDAAVAVSMSSIAASRLRWDADYGQERPPKIERPGVIVYWKNHDLPFEFEVDPDDEILDVEKENYEAAQMRDLFTQFDMLMRDSGYNCLSVLDSDGEMVYLNWRAVALIDADLSLVTGVTFEDEGTDSEG